MKKLLLAVAASVAAFPLFSAQTQVPATKKENQPRAVPAAQVVPAVKPAATSTNAKPDIAELLNAESFTNETGMVLVRIRPGFWAGKYLVTQEEYQKVSGGNPSQFKGQRNPVDSVSWSDAVSFCARLNEAERKAEMLPEGFIYDLPTQGQWETLMNGATLKEAVTSSGASRSGTAPVGSLAPNSLGLFDTRGNVWQWCKDPADKPFRVLRGGAWDTSVEVNLRPEFRWYSNGPDDRKNNYGFRVVLTGQVK